MTDINMTAPALVSPLTVYIYVKNNFKASYGNKRTYLAFSRSEVKLTKTLSTFSFCLADVSIRGTPSADA